MKVVEYNSKIYYLKLSVKDYIAIKQLGIIERLSTYPSTVDYLSLCSILMNKYNFSEDDLYEFMDFVTEEYDMNTFLEELLIDSGIVSNDNNSNSSKSDTTSIECNKEQEQLTFEKQLDFMLKDCLAYGMNVDTFYDMTFHEIQLFIEGVVERRDSDNHDKAMFDYMLANLIALGTGIAFGSKASFPSYEDYYGKMLGDVDNQTNEDDMILEGYATDELGNKTPIYKRKLDANRDIARMELLALAQQQKLNSLQKELDKQKQEEQSK